MRNRTGGEWKNGSATAAEIEIERDAETTRGGFRIHADSLD